MGYCISIKSITLYWLYFGLQFRCSFVVILPWYMVWHVMHVALNTSVKHAGYIPSLCWLDSWQVSYVILTAILSGITPCGLYSWQVSCLYWCHCWQVYPFILIGFWTGVMLYANLLLTSLFILMYYWKNVTFYVGCIYYRCHWVWPRWISLATHCTKHLQFLLSF